MFIGCCFFVLSVELSSSWGRSGHSLENPQVSETAVLPRYSQTMVGCMFDTQHGHETFLFRHNMALFTYHLIWFCYSGDRICNYLQQVLCTNQYARYRSHRKCRIHDMSGCNLSCNIQDAICNRHDETRPNISPLRITFRFCSHRNKS